MTSACSGVVFGLLAGLVFGLVTGLIFGPDAGLDEGLEAGLGFGLTFGLATGLRTAMVTRPGGTDRLTGEPAYANVQVKHRAGMLVRLLGLGLGGGLAAGLGVGLVFGLAGLVAGSTVGPTAGLVAGSVAGSIAGLVTGLVKWVGTPSRDDWAHTPLSTYTATRALTVVQLCICSLGIGLVAGLVTGLDFALAYGLAGGLLTGVEYGLGPGLVFGLGLMSSGAWFSYLLTSCRLAAAGQLPLRLMDFLDDAYRLGLLRTTGPAYQFRHAEFQDHLVRAAADDPAVPMPATRTRLAAFAARRSAE